MLVAHIWMIAIVTVVPSFRLGDDGLATFAAWGHTAPPDLAASVVLACSASLSFFAGLLIAIVTSEVNATIHGRLLPNAIRYVRIGSMWIATVLASSIGAAGAQIAHAEVAVLAALLSVGWFTMGTAVALAGVYRRTSVAVALGVIAMFFYPHVYATSVRSQPVLSVAFAVVLVVVIQRRLYSATARRASSERMQAIAEEWLRSARTTDPMPFASFSNRSSVYWVRAAIAEFPALRRTSRGLWTRFAALQGAFVAAFSYMLNPAQIGLVSISLAQRGLQLSNSVMYPLSRSERARIRFWCALADSALVLAAMGATFAMLHVLRVPQLRIDSFDADRFPPIGYIICALFAFSPIAHLARPVSPLPVNHARFLPMIPALSLMLFTQIAATWAYRRLVVRDAMLPYEVVFAVAIVMQLAHYVVLQRIYRRATLLPVE